MLCSSVVLKGQSVAVFPADRTLRDLSIIYINTHTYIYVYIPRFRFI